MDSRADIASKIVEILPPNTKRLFGRIAEAAGRQAYVRSRMVLVLVVVETALLLMIGSSFYNLFSDEQILWFGGWSFDSDVGTSRSVQFWILGFPMIVYRIVLILLSAPLYYLICHYREEPALDLRELLEDENEYPSVDVLLPRYKEPWEMYGPVVAAAVSLNYPLSKLNVYVCDDGGRLPDHTLEHTVKDKFGDVPFLHYVKRADGSNAKAGNLNNALLGAHGQIVCVIDADHVCHPDFLLRTVPHLYDLDTMTLSKETALHQTPQTFWNETQTIAMLMEAIQLFFFKLVLPAASGCGVGFCCGSGYVMQRNALDAVGGYAYGFTVEDFSTSLALFSQGYKGKYKYEPLTRGVSPASLQELFDQRLRWTYANCQMIFYTDVFKAPISWKAKFASFVVNFGFLGGPLAYFTAYATFIAVCAYFFFYGTVEFSWIAVFAQFLPMIAFLLFMPGMSPLDSLYAICAWFAYMPVNVATLWKLSQGLLRVENEHLLKVKAACEAQAGALPRLAWFNVIMNSILPVLFTCAVFFVPQSQYTWDALTGFTLIFGVAFVEFVNTPTLVSLGMSIFRVAPADGGAMIEKFYDETGVSALVNQGKKVYIDEAAEVYVDEAIEVPVMVNNKPRFVPQEVVVVNSLVDLEESMDTNPAA